MKNNYWLILIIGLSIYTSCKRQINSQITDEKNWKLGWRMIQNSMDENFEIAELQFDSLLNISDRIDSLKEWNEARGWTDCWDYNGYELEIDDFLTSMELLRSCEMGKWITTDDNK